jgi:hypothetical protein
MRTGRPKHKPTDHQRHQVAVMAGFGLRQADVADLLGIAPKTLRKCYRYELDTGAITANAKVAQSLFDNATRHNNVTAQIFWARARMGWKSVADVNIGSTDRPVAIDYTWAPALVQPLPTASAPAARRSRRRG